MVETSAENQSQKSQASQGKIFLPNSQHRALIDRSTLVSSTFSKKKKKKKKKTATEESKGYERNFLASLSPPCCLRRHARTGQQRYRFANAEFLAEEAGVSSTLPFAPSSTPILSFLFVPVSLYLFLCFTVRSGFLPAKARTNAFGEPACASTEIRAA